MPTILKRTALAANGTAEPVTGDANEFVSSPSQVEVGIVADATGVLASVFSGSDQIADEVPVPVATINTAPKYPDDFFATDAAVPGDRIRIKLRDTSGAARVVYSCVKISAVG